jgi:hypothetical protein
METKVKIIPICLALFLYLLIPAMGADTVRYCNNRFGQCASVPALPAEMHDSANGDGRTYLYANGLSIAIYSGYNVFGNDAKAHFDQFHKREGEITYSIIKVDWYVESGYVDNKIFYHKVFIKKNTISGFYIEYPRALKKQLDAVVNQVGISFKASN